MKTIVLGLGNPLLGDDGVGCKVAEEIKKQVAFQSGIDVKCAAAGGFGLMEFLIGYDRAIIIHSIFSEAADVGSILIRKLEDLPNFSGFHFSSGQDVSLQKAMAVGRFLGAYLPREVIVIGISICGIYGFCTELSPAVLEMTPPASHIALNYLYESASK